MILLDNDTKCLVQGITGKQGSFHTEQMLEYNTNILAGVTPGKGGQDFLGVFLFSIQLKKQKRKLVLTLQLFLYLQNLQKMRHLNL